jgi:hypothetical protein
LHCFFGLIGLGLGCVSCLCDIVAFSDSSECGMGEYRCRYELVVLYEMETMNGNNA